MSKLKDIVDKIDMEIMKDKYENMKELINEVDKFIIKKKLMLFGGLALNLLLPKKKRFYKEYTLNDYDCYSKNAKKDALELASYLHKKGYKYIKVRKALHENTYRVFTEFIQILDITHMSPKIYDKLYLISEKEKKTPIYRYYKEKYKLVPFILLKSNLHFELARPITSYYRWEKIYNRLTIINKLINIEYNSKSLINSYNYSTIDEKILKQILKYTINKKLPIIGKLALKYHNIYYKDIIDEIEILSDNIDVTKNDIQKLLKDTIINIEYHNEYKEIYNDYYIIYTKNIKIKLINIYGDCFSILQKSKYNLGSIDTILYFLYREYLLENIKGNDTQNIWNMIMYIEEYLNITDMPVDKRLNEKCYGQHVYLRDILKDKWRKKQTLKYF